VGLPTTFTIPLLRWSVTVARRDALPPPALPPYEDFIAKWREEFGLSPKNAPAVTIHKPRRAAKTVAKRHSRATPQPVTQGATKRCANCAAKVSPRATTCGGKCRTALSRKNKALKAKSLST
jgi:hypothetical protein